MEEKFILELHKYGHVKTEEAVNVSKIVKYANKMRKEKETGPCNLTAKNIGPKPEKRLGIELIQEYLEQMHDLTSKEFTQLLLDDGVHSLDMEWLVDKKEALEYKQKPFPTWIKNWFGKTRKRTPRSRTPWFRKSRKHVSKRRSRDKEDTENENENDNANDNENENKKVEPEKEVEQDEKEDDRKTRIKRKSKNKKQTKKENPAPASAPAQASPRQEPVVQRPSPAPAPRQSPAPAPKQSPAKQSPAKPSPIHEIDTFFPSPKGKTSLDRELKTALTEKITKSKKIAQFDNLRKEYNSGIDKMSPTKLKKLRSEIDSTVGEIKHSPAVGKYTAAIDARNKTIVAEEAIRTLKSNYPSPTTSLSVTPSVAPSAKPSLSPATRVARSRV